MAAAERRQDWPLWVMQQLREVDYVLVIASGAYRQRAEGRDVPEKSRGVQFEASLIREATYTDPGAARRKFLPVLLPGGRVEDIPAFLGPTSTTHYRVMSFTRDGVEAVLRALVCGVQDTAGRKGGTTTCAPGSPGYLGPDTAHVEQQTCRRAEAERSAEGTLRNSWPTVWLNVPSRNPEFVGRKVLLDILHNRLRAGTTAVLPQAMHGMGGVGKTQLAIEYVYRHMADYDVVCWIPAERPAQIMSALADLAERLGLRPVNEAGSVLRAVLESLRVGVPFADWLLVFDNAEEPESIRSYFPVSGPGRILVTSRDARWATTVRSLEVDVFSREESTRLLRRRGPELSENEAERLADVLGDLPLAVEQAAVWRAETGMAAEQYLRLLEEKRIDLLGLSRPAGYQLPVAAAWNVALDRLEAGNPAALRLLQMCAFLAPEPISRSLLGPAAGMSAIPDLASALGDPVRLSIAIREIGRYSLARLDRRTNSVQVHRLVQAVLADRMTEMERRTMQHAAHLLLAASDPGHPETPGNWTRYAELYPHLVVSDAINCGGEQVRQLVLNAVKYLLRWGEHEAGLDLAQRAYDLRRTKVGPEHPQTLSIGRQLGFVLLKRGRYQQAAELNTGLLEMYRRTVGEDDKDTLNALGTVAAGKRAKGEFAAAFKLSERAYRGLVRVGGPDDADTLSAAHNLGVSLRLVGKFTRARDLDQDTWARFAQACGEDHPSSLWTQIGLAIDRQELGDGRGACALHEQITARYRHLLGENSADTLFAMHHLSVARRRAGDPAGARALAAEVLPRYTARYGEDYPDAAACRLALSVDLRQAGILTTAAQLGVTAVEQYSRILGALHPHTLTAQANLAITLRLRGDTDTARAINETVVRRLRSRLGRQHPLTLACVTNLASDLYAQGQLSAAHDRDVATWERAKRTLGADHPSTLACATNLGSDLRALGRAEEAEILHTDTVGRLRRTLGAEHPATTEAVDWQHRANTDLDPMPL
jgi:tetratricopeptide (TPR) repeat protein